MAPLYAKREGNHLLYLIFNAGGTAGLKDRIFRPVPGETLFLWGGPFLCQRKLTISAKADNVSVN